MDLPCLWLFPLNSHLGTSAALPALLPTISAAAADICMNPSVCKSNLIQIFQKTCHSHINDSQPSQSPVPRKDRNKTPQSPLTYRPLHPTSLPRNPVTPSGPPLTVSSRGCTN
ncbi:hypothetical protein HDV57DRAFT_254021 [Trichoderma longibrachiatum]